MNRNPTGYGREMLDEYCRVVLSAKPDWFLYENIALFPSFEVDGYTQQRFELELAWFTEFSRCRYFIFGSSFGKLFNPIKGETGTVTGEAVLGNDERSFAACCYIQGLPKGFDVPFFSLDGKKRAIANGVPLQMSRYLTQLILRDFYGEEGAVGEENPEDVRKCLCGCGRIVVGCAQYNGASCR